jgi:hypothetical protein
MDAGNSGDFSASLTDLMASVAVIFLLIAGIFIVRTAISQETKEQGIERLLKELKEGNKNFIQEAETVKGDPFLARIRIMDEQLQFENKECTLSALQQERVGSAMRKMLEELFRKAQKNGVTVEQVILEGHTDHNPFFPLDPICGIAIDGRYRACRLSDLSEGCRTLGFENNVRLSAARAQAVFFATRESLRDSEIFGWFEKKFVVAGRGPVEPKVFERPGVVAWEEMLPGPPERFRENRRVEAKVRFCRTGNPESNKENCGEKQ